jgi:hypothetical protein
MTKKILVLILLIGVIAGCKKKSNDDSNPNTDGKTCLMLTCETIYLGDTIKTLYIRNPQKQLIAQKSVFTNGDTATDLQYHYENNSLKYSFWSYLPISDTVFFYYDSQQRIIRTFRILRNGTSTHYQESKFLYNSDNKVERKVTKNTYDSITYTTDSLLYIYTGDNISLIKEYRIGPSMTVYKEYFNFVYDDKKNKNLAKGEPPISMNYWSKNNILQYTYGSETYEYTMNVIINSYNSSGYPLDEYFDSSPDPGNFTFLKMTYECE